MAGPPGVDGYLEQIRPTWVVGACRAEVVGVEHSTPDSVTLRLRANRAWEGFVENVADRYPLQASGQISMAFRERQQFPRAQGECVQSLAAVST